MPARSENLSAYLDGELTAAEIAELEAEFAADASVRAELESLEAVVDFVRANGPLEAPAGFADAVLARVAEEPAQAGGALVWLRRPMGIPLEALAVAAAAVFVLVFALQSGEDGSVSTTAREVFDPAEATPVAATQPAEDQKDAEGEEAYDDGIAQVDWDEDSKKKSPRKQSAKGRIEPAPAAKPAPAPMVGTGDVERLQSKELAVTGGTTEELEQGTEPMPVVPWNYTLHSGDADVLKQLDRIARRHGGELQTESGQPYAAKNMLPGKARVFVYIPNTQISAFATEIRALGQVQQNTSQNFFPGDKVRLEIEVDYQMGTTTYSPSSKRARSEEVDRAATDE